jgi:hypothetical protein
MLCWNSLRPGLQPPQATSFRPDGVHSYGMAPLHALLMQCALLLHVQCMQWYGGFANSSDIYCAGATSCNVTRTTWAVAFQATPSFIADPQYG